MRERVLSSRLLTRTTIRSLIADQIESTDNRPNLRFKLRRKLEKEIRSKNWSKIIKNARFWQRLIEMEILYYAKFAYNKVNFSSRRERIRDTRSY